MTTIPTVTLTKITAHVEMTADHTLVDEMRGRSALKAGTTYAVDVDVAEALIDAKLAAPVLVNIAGPAPTDGSTAQSILDGLNARHAKANAPPAALAELDPGMKDRDTATGAVVVSHPTGDVISDPSAPAMTTKEG